MLALLKSSFTLGLPDPKIFTPTPLGFKNHHPTVGFSAPFRIEAHVIRTCISVVKKAINRMHFEVPMRHHWLNQLQSVTRVPVKAPQKFQKHMQTSRKRMYICPFLVFMSSVSLGIQKMLQSNNV